MTPAKSSAGGRLERRDSNPLAARTIGAVACAIPTRSSPRLGVAREHESSLSAAHYARLVRMTLLRIRTPAAMHGAISEATRKGGPEFQGVARNQPTRGSVPRATAEACHLDRGAATTRAAGFVRR